MLSYEAGPWDVFARLRRLFGVPDGMEDIEGFFPLLLSCVWCCGWWTAAAMWLLWPVAPAIPAVFAAAAVVVLVERRARG